MSCEPHVNPHERALADFVGEEVHGAYAIEVVEDVKFDIFSKNTIGIGINATVYNSANKGPVPPWPIEAEHVQGQCEMIDADPGQIIKFVEVVLQVARVG